MTYLISMFELLMVGVTILMAGNFLLINNRGMGVTLQRAVGESLAWGVGFFIAFAAEFTLLSVSTSI
jgi:hypothetical protein